MPTRSVPRSGARAALVEATTRHLSSRGPVAVLPKDVCDELGLSKALVNYHFGSRGGLVAAAMVHGSEQHLVGLRAAVESAGPESIDRLVAWVVRRIEWAVEHPGLVAALGFVDLVNAAGDQMPAETRVRLAELAAAHDDLLAELVAAARPASHTGDLADDVTAISWLSAGAAVSLAGSIGRRAVGIDGAVDLVRSLVDGVLHR